ncbi:vacuolar membrane protein [Carex littledalei]|uniref:Vacuolar membrane protein n=1 Tax=Carex littledalei TaxID=544730 RepID=A0A833R916_9POAL|nr:vacuolar membrane protein [Carex littledalei]
MESTSNEKADSENMDANIDRQGYYSKQLKEFFNSDKWRWILGLIYLVAVAGIWIAASYIVQSVVDSGVSPFLITYICNSLFVVYIPIVEVSRYFEDSVAKLLLSFNEQKSTEMSVQNLADLESVNLLQATDSCRVQESKGKVSEGAEGGEDKGLLDSKGRWTRTRMAKVSILICPFWFFAQLTFNLSLKYTTVASNTILSSTSSLFTFLVALFFLGEKFTWIKLASVLMCMAGTIIVSLADSNSQSNEIATNPLLGDILTLLSAGLYAIYITLIRKKLPDEKEGKGEASTAQFLGFLGLFNMLIFLPVILVLHFTGVEPFHRLTWQQVSLIIGKGLLDNVLSDYLWAKAINLTTTTVATAGLTIQVPIAAVVDSITGHAPHLLDYVGAAAVLVGFAGINVPYDACSGSKYEATTGEELESQEVVVAGENLEVPTDRRSSSDIS